MKKLGIVFIGLLLASPAFAAVAKVTVKGMVCAFCAQGIKRNFSQEDAVKSVDVSLEKKEVNLEFKDGKNLPDTRIAEIITGAGYNIEKIERKK